MRQLAFAAQMRELDRKTIEETGIPGMVLMENAGRATVELMQKHFGPVAGKTVCIFAGPGNNGGDGLVVARTVYNLGAFPFVFFLCDPRRLSGDAGQNFLVCQKLRLPFHVLKPASMNGIAHLLRDIFALRHSRPLHSFVDAIFGTGLERPVEGHFFSVINDLNHLRKDHGTPVISLDIPSGLHSDTGAVLGTAIQADLTVTYALAKPGHLHHGGSLVGRLECVEIGIPQNNIAQAKLPGLALNRHMAEELLRPRAVASHKGSNGHVLIVAGCTGKTGAALLCGQGALRSGAGLVSLAAPQALQPVFAANLAEAMTAPMPHSRDFFVFEDYEHLRELMQDKQALVIGPGLGLQPESAELVFRLYQEEEAPQVIDADALTLLAKRPEIIRRPGGPRIFTPHPGEMSRLLGCPVEDIQKDRLRAASWLNNEEGQAELVTILKGAGTVVAENQGRFAINTSGNAGMGSGGMGDVLAGTIGGLLAQGHSPWAAACLAVYLHGVAADQLALARPWGYTASEVAQALPVALGNLFFHPSKKELSLC